MSQHQQLHQYLIAAVGDIRQKFSNANMGQFRLDIEISGPTMGSNQSKIEYNLSPSSYGSSGTATGGNLSKVIEEVIRRHDWEEKNAPLEIGYQPR